MILLSNFDSVLNNMFKGMIEVNYNYFNHLDSVIDNKPKYKLKVSANSLLYWNNDTHDSKSSENKEDKITKMIIFQDNKTSGNERLIYLLPDYN